MTKAEDDYEFAKRLYDAWKDEHPKVDAWKDETGARLAKAFDEANAARSAEERQG